jgi:hypothetical protein
VLLLAVVAVALELESLLLTIVEWFGAKVVVAFVTLAVCPALDVGLTCVECGDAEPLELLPRAKNAILYSACFLRIKD